jgi:hypothetical protein
MKELSHFPIPLPLDKIKRRLKIPPSANFTDYDPLIEKLFTLVETGARYEEIGLTMEKGKLILSDGYEIISDSLSNHLENCRKVSLLGVTVGKFIEEEIEKYQQKGRNLEALILDALGSECVEEAALFVSALIHDIVKKNKCTPTKRFSPGYGDLSLEVQKYFFQQLKLEELGMRLNASLLMLPQKSITAFIGWGECER